MNGPVRRGGYTLIELLIVIILLGIATSMVAPSLKSTDVLRVQSTIRVIVSDINYMQSDALARQQCRAIVFDVENNRYSLYEAEGSTIDPQTDLIYTVKLNDDKRFHTTKIESAVFDGGNMLIFDEMGGPVDALGSSTPGSGGVIIVSGSGALFRIEVEAYTGRVTVSRHEP